MEMNDLAFEQHCVKSSVEVFYDAAKLDRGVPSRLKHLKILPITFCKEIKTILEKVALLGLNILAFLFIPYELPGNRLNTFFWRFKRLFIFDPISSLTSLVNAVIRITATILGCIAPRIALKGWTLAEQIDLLAVTIRSAAWQKKIAIEKRTMQIHYRTVQVEVKYTNPERYLILFDENKNTNNNLDNYKKLARPYSHSFGVLDTKSWL